MLAHPELRLRILHDVSDFGTNLSTKVFHDHGCRCGHNTYYCGFNRTACTFRNIEPDGLGVPQIGGEALSNFLPQACVGFMAWTLG